MIDQAARALIMNFHLAENLIDNKALYAQLGAVSHGAWRRRRRVFCATTTPQWRRRIHPPWDKTFKSVDLVVLVYFVPL